MTTRVTPVVAFFMARSTSSAVPSSTKPMLVSSSRMGLISSGEYGITNPH
ncbi:hypothetical protein [Streptomyces sp. SM11]|nr:hypothetical protein [Streptomyces sp. SM11]